MDSVESEWMSVLLSTYLERKFTGTEETINIKRRAIVLHEQLSNVSETIFTGSFGEGCHQYGSDADFMIVNKAIAVMYPDQSIPQHLAHKTIFYIREADCRPGYVHLEIGQLNLSHDLLINSLVRIRNSLFISSDIFREDLISRLTTGQNIKYESNGPSCTATAIDHKELIPNDIVNCFHCDSWPKEANEWIKRSRLYGWPHQTLIDKIVNNGCHLVPVGDKCSKDTLLQWRISFAAAEKSLVHSFSHIQVKVYALLKYFLKQIKQTLKETIGDDDILCSYFLKTIMFHAIENSSQMFWQDKNLFYCFWFCFNILIAWVRAGFCPNYFINANNMFQRKVHGQNQQILLDILDNFCQMKWMCLSVGNFFKRSIWEDLCNPSIQADLVCPMTAQRNIMEQDKTALGYLAFTSATYRTINRAIYFLSTSKSDIDELCTYKPAMDSLRCLALKLFSKDLPENRSAPENKTRYRRLRKCKYWMTPNALFGTDVLYLATFHFLTGNFGKCLEMSRQAMKLASNYRDENYLHRLYRHQPHGRPLERLQKIYNKYIQFHCGDMHFPYLYLELRMKDKYLEIPPLPYALFLNFLCSHELGDSSGRDKALHNLKQVQYDEEQGGQKFWIVPTLLGICYQILGNYNMAIRAYWESAQSKNIDFPKWNPAIDRIAIVYLCMYVSQRSDRG
ncbi:uncharacterized protein LOC117326901 [Pecten maximus]|uniref:uncharacterized protein LOC117326901 n=1 Tax=Pecten maximus TaxID=6579 RepID=UPI00145817EB|nr:uncharacterized protein LOC117326901 [Pecten maximus]